MSPQDDFKRNVVTIRMTEEAMRDHQMMDDYWDRIEAGFTVFGPTQPTQEWLLPPYDEGRSDEWKALWEIADGSRWGDDEAADIALSTIGHVTWKPGPKPGYRPGLAEAMGRAINRVIAPSGAEGDLPA